MCNVNVAKAWFSVISMEKSRKFVTGVKAKTLLSNFCCGENTINATALSMEHNLPCSSEKQKKRGKEVIPMKTS